MQAIEREPDGRVRVDTTTGAAYHFDRLAVTLPTRLFLRLARGLPEAYRTRWEQGPLHLGAHCLVLALDRPLMPPVYWLSIADPGLPFLAAVEHTNFLPGERLRWAPPALPRQLPADGPRAVRCEDGRVLDTFLPHLRKLNPAFEPSWVREHWVWKAPFAQPVVTDGYLQRFAATRDAAARALPANMAHVYPQDRGQNYSLRLGEKLAGRVGWRGTAATDAEGLRSDAHGPRSDAEGPRSNEDERAPLAGAQAAKRSPSA